jgi:NAD(P)-dependent dehydrogenase (short-subunit alcohol dehydrogenase family)
MLTAAIASRLEGDGITVNSCHPGDVRSKLSTDLGFGGHESPEQGARTPVYLATSAEVSGITGKYFARSRPERCQFAEHSSAVEALYQACRAYA